MPQYIYIYIYIYSVKEKEREKFQDTGSFHNGCQSRRPIPMAKYKMFTDPLAAAAESLKNSTSQLSPEAGIRQIGAVEILQEHRWHHYTRQVYQYHNEDISLVSPTAHTGFTKCCVNIRI